MAKITKIQTVRTPWSANYMTLAKLGDMLALKPYQMEGVVNRIYSSLNYNETPFTQSLIGNRTMEITSNEWEWKMRGATEIPDTIVKTTSAEDVVAGRSFTLYFSRDMWVYGDEISPGDSTHRFQCRIVKNPYRYGNGFAYEVELSNATSIPQKFLEAGAQWNKLFSAYGEAAVQGGSTQFSGTFAMRNKLGKLRKQYKVDDYAWEEVLAIKVTDSNGNTHDFVDDFAMVEFRKQWLREIEKALIFSRTTENELDSTGNKVDKFPGLIQQIQEYGNYFPSSNITLRKIEDFVDGITYNKFSPEQTVVMEMYTGRKGLQHFSRLIEAGIGNKTGWQLQNGSGFDPVKSMSSPYHSNAYSYGYQFLEYRMPNNIILRPKVLPMLDDVYNQFELHEGFPKSSMSYLFLDISPVGNENSNIKMITKKNGFKTWYVDGGISHSGPQRGGSAAHGGEWYEMHISKELGLHIEDPTRTGMLELI